MEYLYNAWYCAAWSEEVGEKPLGRTLLGEDVVLYRDGSGAPVAVSGICPHRFAPMELGKLNGDRLVCPYHGLEFGPDGSCTLNPHGDTIPPKLRLKSYPAVERDAVVWLWMGDAEKADEATIPNLRFRCDPAYSTVQGYIASKGNYQLVTDNLLDLSHTQYLHPMLTFPEAPDAEHETNLRQEGDVLLRDHNDLNAAPSGVTMLTWPEKQPARHDTYSTLRWEAPANMTLMIRQVSRDPDVAVGATEIWAAHLVTPETQTSSHYFWSMSRDFRIDDPATSEQIYAVTQNVFSMEDGMMIDRIQRNMGDQTDLIAMRPVILPTDMPSVRARGILRKKIAAERGGEASDDWLSDANAA